MANTLSFDQISTVLNEIVAQATGAKPEAVVDTASFVSVAQTALLHGYDPMNTAISQVLARTIFSIRPYYSKFKGLRVTAAQYGNHVRKLNPIDPKFVDDPTYDPTMLEDSDQYNAPRPKVLQTNWYGQEAVALPYTVWRDQLKSAFRGPDELASYYTMMAQNIADMLEQKNESMSRMVLANLMTGVFKAAPNQVVHLLTEYNTETGGTFTAEQIKLPENYPAFIQWVYGRVASLSAALTDRTQLYHINITNSPVSRHTPYERQRVYLFAPERYMMDSRVLATTFHDNYLRFADTETVNFWQNPQSPDTIITTPVYLNTDGSLTTATEAVTLPNVFGVIMDEEAAGYNITNEWVGTTPFHAKGGFSVTWWHFLVQYWNDFTENVIVMCMD